MLKIIQRLSLLLFCGTIIASCAVKVYEVISLIKIKMFLVSQTASNLHFTFNELIYN